MLLILTIIPLVVLGYLAIGDAKELGLNAANESALMGETAITDSTEALNSLGEKMIAMQAESVSARIRDFLKSHPDMTADEISTDPRILEIMKEPVGETGYLSLSKWTEENSPGIFAYHPSKSLIGIPFIALKDKLPKIVEIGLKVSAEKKSGGGYYPWIEEDGSIRDKYVWITSHHGETTTLDGYEMVVSATTYIDEFSKPAIETEKKIKMSLDSSVSKILLETNSLSTQNTILMITIVTILITIIASVIFAQSLTRPLKQLTKAGRKISQGDLDVQIPEIKTNDEIKDLSESFKSAFAAIKFLMENDDNKK